MDREIKFRAWNSHKKIMLDWNHFIIAKHLLFIDSYNWMQFTGLKDKNGKEIYEGDILRQANGFIWTVFFLEAQFRKKRKGGVKDPDIVSTGLWSIASYESVYEVIGNIYQNPELLK